MKLFWTGTDSLMLVDYSMRKLRKKPYWFIFRMLIRMMDIFVEGHYCDSNNVADNVMKFGVKKKVQVFKDKLNHPVKYPKKKHEGFNVIYYNPSGGDRDFREWLYGLDIIASVESSLPGITFVELDGSKDMSKIYPIADFCLRPNRHDGSSRMVQECKINNIPYYHTWADNANINTIINQITNEYSRQS